MLAFREHDINFHRENDSNLHVALSPFDLFPFADNETKTARAPPTEFNLHAPGRSFFFQLAEMTAQALISRVGLTVSVKKKQKVEKKRQKLTVRGKFDHCGWLLCHFPCDRN